MYHCYSFTISSTVVTRLRFPPGKSTVTTFQKHKYLTAVLGSVSTTIPFLYVQKKASSSQLSKCPLVAKFYLHYDHFNPTAASSVDCLSDAIYTKFVFLDSSHNKQSKQIRDKIFVWVSATYFLLRARKQLCIYVSCPAIKLLVVQTCRVCRCNTRSAVALLVVLVYVLTVFLQVRIKNKVGNICQRGHR